MDWYYQIKGRLSEPAAGLYGGSQNWSWPPVFSGRVEADTKKEAHALVNAEYGKQFPLRVLAKDLEANEFLLNISEITDERTKGLFVVRACQQCGTTFRIIDSYNANSNYKGSDFCSWECRTERYEVQKFIDSGNDELGGIHPPVIYRCYNHETGLSYVGKTTQAFTLRWYQHFFQTGDTKFHKAIKSSSLSDWTFHVIEKVIIPADIKTKADIEKLILEREKYWIKKYDSMVNGYNSKC